MMDLIPTNKLQYERRTIVGKDKKGKDKLYKARLLQQWWANPFVEGEGGEWVDVPTRGRWDEDNKIT